MSWSQNLSASNDKLWEPGIATFSSHSPPRKKEKAFIHTHTHKYIYIHTYQQVSNTDFYTLSHIFVHIISCHPTNVCHNHCHSQIDIGETEAQRCKSPSITGLRSDYNRPGGPCSFSAPCFPPGTTEKWVCCRCERWLLTYTVASTPWTHPWTPDKKGEWRSPFCTVVCTFLVSLSLPWVEVEQVPLQSPQRPMPHKGLRCLLGHPFLVWILFISHLGLSEAKSELKNTGMAFHSSSFTNTYHWFWRCCLTNQNLPQTNIRKQKQLSLAKVKDSRNPVSMTNKFMQFPEALKKQHLAGVAQWTECRPANKRVAGLIPSLELMPGLRARSPVGGVREATTHWCFSPSLSPFPSPKNK